MIDDADYGENSKGTGTLLKLTMAVSEGPKEKRLVFENMNLTHSNPVAQKIGRGTYRKLLTALGAWPPKDGFDTEDLIGQEFEGFVTTEKGKEGRDDQSRIRRYREISDGELKQEEPKKGKSTASKEEETPRRSAPWKKQKAGAEE